jgi:CRP-like cAMP-binding protein
MTDLPIAERSASQTSGGLDPGLTIACESGRDIVQAKDPNQLYRLVDGWAFGARMFEDGRRQIVGFLLPGDLINADAVLGDSAGVPLYALTDVRLQADYGDNTAKALPAALAQMASLCEQVVSLGRRTAYERIAAFLLQIGDRLDGGAGSPGHRYLVPLRLEHLADHLGLSVVHVSRTMRQLRGNGLASLYRGELELGDRGALARVSEYSGARALTGWS